MSSGGGEVAVSLGGGEVSVSPGGGEVAVSPGGMSVGCVARRVCDAAVSSGGGVKQLFH